MYVSIVREGGGEIKAMPSRGLYNCKWYRDDFLFVNTSIRCSDMGEKLRYFKKGGTTNIF
jgi:hypothetical protein